MGAEIGVGALLGAAGLSSLGNVTGSALSAHGASKTNEALMAFNAEEAAKNRKFQKEMYNQQLSDQENMYKKYQSPEAIAKQLMVAGINPASVLGQGQGMGNIPSVPSVSGGSQASVGSLENPMAAYGQALKSTTSDAVSVLNAITDKNLKDKQALKVLSDKASVDTQNEILQWQNMINHTVGSQKAKEELNRIIVETATLATAGDLNKARTLVADTIQKLNNKEFDLKDEELSQLQLRGLFLADSLSKQLQLQDEEIKTEKSKQADNYASAREHRENASTISSLRKWQVEFEKARSEIANVDSFVERNNQWYRCEARLAELRAKRMLPEQVEQDIRLAKKKGDWYEVNELLGIVDEGVKAAGTYYGAKTGKGFVDAQNVSNSITEKYNNFKMSHDSRPAPTYNARQGYR